MLTLKEPEKLQLYRHHMYYVLHKYNFTMFRVWSLKGNITVNSYKVFVLDHSIQAVSVAVHEGLAELHRNFGPLFLSYDL